MKYVAVVAPVSSFSGDTDAFRRLASHYFRNFEDNELERHGFRIKRPAQTSPTEWAAVEWSGSAGGGSPRIGTLLSLDPGEYFDTDDVQLWLPHGLFPDGTPEHIVLSLGSDGGPDGGSGIYRRFERTQLDGVQVPYGLLARTTCGALFRNSEEPPDLSRFPVLSVVKSSRCAQPPHLWGVLNPWTITLDTAVGIGPGDNRLFQDAIEAGLVDFHVAFRPTDWLRARVHVNLCAWWQSVKAGLTESEFPPIPRLLFGTGGLSPEKARSFLVLDELNGQFHIGGFGSPGSEAATFTWSPRPSGSPGRASSRDCLIHNSLNALGLPRPDGEPAVPGDMLLSFDEQARSDIHEEATQKLSDVFGELFTDAMPEVLGRLMSVCEGPITVREADEVRSAARAASGTGRFDPRRFLQGFCRRIVMPRSSIRVDLPAPPRWLESNQHARWEKEQFDAVTGCSSTIPRWRLEEWWLSLIQPEPHVAVKPDWQVWNRWWKRHFRVSLFRWPSDFVPDWGLPPRYGVLGRATLGAGFHLGGSVPHYVHGPWDDWPQTLAMEDCP